jgi:hypothetical protein
MRNSQRLQLKHREELIHHLSIKKDVKKPNQITSKRVEAVKKKERDIAK